MLQLEPKTLDQMTKTSKSRDRLNDICKEVEKKNKTSKKEKPSIKKFSKAS